MSGEIITIIISALSAAIAAPVGAWVGRKLERDKYRIELERLRAEMKDKLAEVKSHELENVRKAADILMESIVPPLKAEITNLRNDVQRLNTALERIWGCRHIDHCPVKYELLLAPQGRERKQDGSGGAAGDDGPARKPARTAARGDPDDGDGEPGGYSDGG
ncbi:hypothetical protein [Muribaculum intestinale]|uniref:hypothetical protein n=1 Tax=Muribaculum intestinale TaxID=1796646 RepID=UPI0025A989AA|nr:hypothetical protein [Muribaculum intestinale]